MRCGRHPVVMSGGGQCRRCGAPEFVSPAEHSLGLRRSNTTVVSAEMASEGLTISSALLALLIERT